MTNNQDSYYLSLLALAETFRCDQPPRIRHAIHCLQAVLTCDPPPKVAGRTHLQLATLLTRHTTNTQRARDHLQQAWNLSQNISGFDEVRFSSVHQLCNHLMNSSTPADTHTAKSLLMRAVDLSTNNVHWHCRLLLHAARICQHLREHTAACELLQRGIVFTNSNTRPYMKSIFTLARIMVMMQEGSAAAVEMQQLLTKELQIIEAIDVTNMQREHLKMFCLVLLTTTQLNMGQVKTTKPVLKQLQQSIQNVSLAPQADSDGSCSEITWMSRGELGVLVFLVSVRHSMHAGYMEKATKYTDKALTHLSKIRDSPCAGWLESLLVEQTAQCHLMTGSMTAALGSITRLTQLLTEHPALQQSHVAQVHTLLAVYAMTMEDLPAAEQQFNAALRSLPNRELWTFANLNLGLVYLHSGREADFVALQDRILPDKVGVSHSLKAAAYYVQGMHAYVTNGHDDAKRHLREALKMANAEDLNRLTSCALVLLGHLFYVSGASREAANMASPAMQLAAKIPALHLQRWAAAILRDIHTSHGEAAAATVQDTNHQQFSEQLRVDTDRASLTMQHGELLAWTTGPLPVCPAVPGV